MRLPKHVRLPYHLNQVSYVTFSLFPPLCLLTSPTGLKAGDSGSWVFDCQNYQVYGHVVAVDLFEEGIVVPMHAILIDIKQELNATDVWLHGFPGRHTEIKALPQTPRLSPRPTFNAGYVPMDVVRERLSSFIPKRRNSFIDSAHASPNRRLYACDSQDPDTPGQSTSLKRRGLFVDGNEDPHDFPPEGNHVSEIQPRSHPLYQKPKEPDRLYRCPFQEESKCNHEPTAQKSGYE